MNESQDLTYNPFDEENQYELFPLVSGIKRFPTNNIDQSYRFLKKDKNIFNQINLTLSFLDNYLDYTYSFGSRNYNIQVLLRQMHVHLKRALNLGFQGFYTEGLTSLRSVFEWLLKICDLEIDYIYTHNSGDKGKKKDDKEKEWNLKFENYFLRGSTNFPIKNKIDVIISKLKLTQDISSSLIEELKSFYFELSKSSHMSSIKESSLGKNMGYDIQEYFPIYKKESFIEFCNNFTTLIGYISLLIIIIKPELLDEREAFKIHGTNSNLSLPLEGFWVGFVRSHLAIIPEDYRELVKNLYKEQ